ncbi:glucans biosynthesis glucosyltransferase MdoH [Acidisphaera sp. L21]|uniref:glucans biosynthesis glucosyltransferase MdoH n=1 Tax=Acidisphaera sp. L21 TaxID=1641851 RepID=UPI00131CC5E4|nr:glucans biosynthesis glucosyltransferase MdoH [Acidisphaera sp. L21]
MDHISPDSPAALPLETPLDMPVQALRGPAAPRMRPVGKAPHLVWLRRLVVIVPAIAMTVQAAREMAAVLDSGGITTLIVVLMVLFVALFAWIALSFTSSVAGFISCLFRGGRRLGIGLRTPLPSLGIRTALLMPTYNEQPSRVMAGLEAIQLSLRETGQGSQFDTFILSDTTDADVWVAEEAAFLALRDRLGSGSRVFYRRRPINTERKAGNIADWVRRWGGGYPQFLILDADSVMTGDALVRLAAAMEQHLEVGLIQTLPTIANGNSLFARMQQFAGRVYGPVIAHGIAWWHGAEGNYWGHNAMIRTVAFAEQAGLPLLRGRKPFGGHILSHDFVEAALIRRGGWAVHMVPGLPGSYEESPPSLPDLAVRDRRWCQGNLQHIAVLPSRGLHWVSRMHLLTGIGSYITAPMWLAFILVGILISLQSRFIRPDYFPNGKSLFPTWPIIDPERAKLVFIGTMALLLAPKLLAYIALLFDSRMRRGCGGAIRAMFSLLLETVIAGLLAPVTMLTQSLDVFAILLGRDSGWNAQRRDDGSIPFGMIARLYAWHTLFGISLAVASFLVSPYLLAWMSPVVIGQALAIPLVLVTGSAGIGRGLRRIGLLRIPEEVAPPPVLVMAVARAREMGDGPTPEAMRRLRDDPALWAAHVRMLPPTRRRSEDAGLATGLAKLEEADTLEAAAAAMTRGEKAAVLGSAAGLDRLGQMA